MSAIITDQFRVLNAENFIKSFVSSGSTTNYYTFIGQPNSLNPLANGDTNWNQGPPPTDGFDEENKIKETIISLKKINPTSDLRRVVRKIEWTAGRTYDMYRNNYTINNLSPVTKATNLYNSDYYVVNQNFKVYICLNNGSDSNNPEGRPSLDEPDFVDLDPRQAGSSSGDGYIWKYLFTIPPKDIVKFDSVDYIPVPENWGFVGESIDIKNNAIDGKIDIVLISNQGSKYSPGTYKDIPILGDGVDGKCTIIVGSTGTVDNVFVTDGGNGYTKGTVNFKPGALGIPINLTHTGLNTELAKFEVIIPPKGGHGYDIYRELGAYRVLLYTRFTTDETNPDTIVGNDFSRVGIIKNPTVSGSNTQVLDTFEVSGLKSLKLSGIASLTTYPVDSIITQTTGTGTTATGFVASWDNVTGVLKYYQPVGLATEGYNYELKSFTSSPAVGGSLQINCSSISGPILSIDSTFNGTTTVINNRTYQLGSNFISGISSEEYNKKSGEIIYIDNRQPIPRSISQKEDIKIILEF